MKADIYMKIGTILLFFFLSSLSLFLHPITVKADIAPPQLPPGANLEPGESEVPTLVRMAAENVVIVVEKTAATLGGMEDLSASDMRARVEAEFTMHNDGRDDEAFEVWFPLMDSDGFTGVVELEDFYAWVDGREAKIERKYFPNRAAPEGMPWVAWRVKFPAGEDVTIRVSYIMRPTGYRPFGTFSYILETGAKWHGKIGEGTITFRLPYAVDKFNTAMNPHTDSPPNPPDYRVSGADIIWHFQDLEPSQSDNIRVTILNPKTWESIEQTRAEFDRTPTSAQAALNLARALEAALQYKYGLVDIGDSVTILNMADDAYRRAIELDPRSGQAYKDYAFFLDKQSLYWMGNKSDPALENLLPVLERALEFDPADERLLEIRRNIEGAGITIPTAVPIPSTEAVMENGTMEAPRNRETQRPDIEETAETVEQPITLSPTPQESSMQNFGCQGGLATVLLPVGAWFFSRQRIKRR